MYGAGGANRSRVAHVIADLTDMDAIRAAVGQTRTAACGQDVTVLRVVLKGEANEVCLNCRKAMGWPMVVTWTQHGHTFTTDFSKH